MKRSVIIITHILAIMLALAGFIALHGYSVDGRGISSINTSHFEDSIKFSDMVSEDLSKIRRLAVLQNAFENDGELDTDMLVAGATTVNGNISYTVSDIMNIAKTFGYSIDYESKELSYTKVTEEPNNYQVKLHYKAYDPYYFDNITPGPSQGVMTIKELCIETLRAVAEYYSLRSVYDAEESNFKYNAYFVSNDNEDVSVGNVGENGFDAAGFGRYLIVSDSMDINTNINPIPSNVMPDSSSFGFGDTDGNVLELGIDTSYLYNDRYREAAEDYGAYIGRAYAWLTAFVIGLIVSAISLVLVVRDKNFASSGRIYALDKLPVEGMLAVQAFAAVFIYALFRAALYNFMDVFINEDDWGFWCTTVKSVIVYAFLVGAMCSMYRRSHYGGMFKNSLISRAIAALGDENENTVRTTLIPYVLYIAVNAACIGGSVYFLTNGFFNRYYYFAAIMLILFAAALDIYAYLTVYGRNRQRGSINTALRRISQGEVGYTLETDGFTGGELEAVESINSISDGLKSALNEQVKADRLKADLITNVSHDIKTPLTSIINYVDLIKRENIDNEKVREYIDVLDKKSARLKNLTEDLVEASKASSGNIKLDMCKLDMAELAIQAGGEFEDKFAARHLEFNLNTGDGPAYVMADGRHLWRVFENLLNNAAKYAMENTRIYADVEHIGSDCVFSIKNISQSKLNISPEELTERFIRGDVSRSTEGSGLGLNIAQSLTKLMGGRLVIEIDGDLYKAKVIMPCCGEKESGSSSASVTE